MLLNESIKVIHQIIMENAVLLFREGNVMA